MAPSHLLNIPNELLLNVMSLVEPEDILSLSETCKQIRETYKGNNSVVLRQNLKSYMDEPPELSRLKIWNHEERFKNLVAVRDIYGGRFECSWRTPAGSLDAQQQILTAVDKTIDLVRYASSDSESSINLDFLQKAFSAETSSGKENIENFLCRSMIYTRARYGDNKIAPKPFSELERQASAKLHCYYGVPVNVNPSRYRNPYAYAMSMVYDLRNYTDQTLWGPFKADGKASVDWEKVEAIMIILGHDLKCFDDQTGRALKPLWKTAWAGSQPDSFRTIGLLDKQNPTPPLNDLDPYNITGSWMRIVTFLDYHELFRYNFCQPPEGQSEDVPRPPLLTTEAIRLIIMELEVDKIVPSKDPKQPLPKVYFHGISRSLHSPHDPNANSNIRGTVQMTEEGEVRWSTMSVYNGEERWKSEGIQIGGVRSARGILGHWFDRDMDNEQGPAGPTAFWKVSNEVDNADQMDFWIAVDDEDEDEETDADAESQPPLAVSSETPSLVEDVVLTAMLGAVLAEAADALNTN